MARSEKQWHPNFIKYMNMIINNPNYAGLPILQNPDGSFRWLAPAESEIGKGRIQWCVNKATALGLTNSKKMYADVMLAIHPTKRKVCQICGKEMSLYYHYPNGPFIKGLNKKFNTDFGTCDHICDIWDELLESGIDQTEIAAYLISKGNLPLNPQTSSKDEIIDALELVCRNGEKNCLGPGAMSNFPDRFDGFHSYNRCCRSSQDKGRSKTNLKAYTKDRRAYECWSGGNIHAANQFMGSHFFDGTSADHIGPISLGFVHDPHYLQPMSKSDNSSKRDRLSVEDIENIIETQNRTGVYPMSWQSRLIWEYIRKNYKANPDKVPTCYRDALKQNMNNYMNVLYTILEQCPNNGEAFLVKAFLEPNYTHFKYSYKFNEKGDIVESKPRHNTGRMSNEMERYKRIAIESVYDYNNKDNRNTKSDLTYSEKRKLDELCNNIERGLPKKINYQAVINLIEEIERRLISTL